MSVTITATVGSETANSFVTLAEFRTYLGQRLNSANVLSTRSATDMSIALIDAGREFNEKAWRGVKADDDQSMAWPRRYVMIPDGVEYLASDAIPQAIKDAQCERAVELLESTNAGESEAIIKTFSQGDTRIEYDVRQVASAARRSRLADLLRAYLLSNGRAIRA